MRFGLVALAVISAAVTVSPALSADWTGFYAGIYAGASIRNDADLKGAFVFGEFGEDAGAWPPTAINNEGGVDPLVFDILGKALDEVNYVPNGQALAYIADGTIGFAPGTTLGTVTGYSFGNGFRVESDWSISSFAPVSLSIDGTRVQEIDGELLSPSDEWTWTLQDEAAYGGLPGIDLDGYAVSNVAAFVLGNAWYDFDNDTVFTPYVGGGVGIANVTSTLLIPGGASDSSSAWVPAGQLGAGVTIDLNDKSFLDLGYRFKATAGGSTSVSAVQYLGNGDFIGFGLSQGGPVIVHTLQAGLNIRFD